MKSIHIKNAMDNIFDNLGPGMPTLMGSVTKYYFPEIYYGLPPAQDLKGITYVRTFDMGNSNILMKKIRYYET